MTNDFSIQRVFGDLGFVTSEHHLDIGGKIMGAMLKGNTMGLGCTGPYARQTATRSRVANNDVIPTARQCLRRRDACWSAT